MQKLIVFNNVTADGYFTGANGDFSWAHDGAPDPEFNEFVAGNASGDGQLLFGRVTYELMASYWPTPLAHQNAPVVAEGMNRMPKAVFSRTMDQAAWNNTTLMKGDLVSEVRKLKQESDRGIAILGSGSLVAPLASAGLIDEFQMVINPIVIGAGRTMFDDLKEKLKLKLIKTRTFKSGKIYACYEPAK